MKRQEKSKEGKRTKILNFVVIILALLLFSTDQSNAQFNKYKSKSRFNLKNLKSEKAGKTPVVTATSSIENKDKKDLFGRSNNEGKKVNTKESKKYVNLNPETAFGPEIITSFDFPNVDIIELTKHMQKLTGLNLIISTKDVKGKITILAPTPITVGDAWKAYITALNMNNLTLVKTGAFYKIVNARNVRYHLGKIYTGSFTPDTDNYVLRIVPLKNISSTEVYRQFRPLMTRNGRILEIKQTNTLIIQDTGANINRLVKLIRYLDVPGHDETLHIIPVKHSSAQEIAALLNKITGSKGKSSSRFRSRTSKTSTKDAKGFSNIIAEERTNSIIALATAEGAKSLKALIKKLDFENISHGAGKVHVLYLKYGNAEDLNKTLTTLISGARSTSKRSRSRFSSRSTSSSGSNIFTSEVKISADKENNALVIIASPTDYLTIKNVIKKLDVPRDQVYVEGMIMETNVGKDNTFGINILSAYGSDGLSKTGFTTKGSGLINLMAGTIPSMGGFFAGFGAGRKVEVELEGKKYNVRGINGIITAIASSSNTNVLATPQILALDNEEAEFEIGETVPVPVKTNATNGTSTTSLDEKKVTLKLKLTPQINKVTRMVKLKINFKMDDFSQREVRGNEGYAVNTRNANTVVVVRDRDTMALGGLMRDSIMYSVSKVPLLGDIPILGWLFKHKSKSIVKRNLLIFLTPKILMSYEETAAKNMKDLLNRRTNHLKKVFGADDPFASTAKGLFYKAEKQDKGPLFEDAQNRYQESSESNEGISNETSKSANEKELKLLENEIENDEQLDDQAKTEAPDYQNILKKLNTKKAKQPTGSVKS